MQSALPARFPLADTKCTLARAPDQERKIERTEKIICLQPAHASDCCGCCRPRLGLVRREGDAVETLRRAHTTGGVVTEIMVFRRSALTWRFAPLSLSRARELYSRSLFFLSVGSRAPSFSISFTHSLSTGGRQRQNEAPNTDTRETRKECKFSVSVQGQFRFPWTNTRERPSRTASCIGTLSRALPLSFAALRAHSSLSRPRSAARRRRALEK